MLHQIEGAQAIAHAVAMCRPKVVCAYPITPQTHIVEKLGEMVHAGEVENCAFINVESEMAALSVAIGSQASGVRSYTATSSQGLLYMMESVYNASGMQLPIVMTLGNRTIGAPLNIWNDHSDAMSARDAGWLMLFAETNQEALDLHIQAFKIAETVGCPVMVCVDGFILTHAYEGVDLPTQDAVDEFLPPYNPDVRLDISNPCAMGMMVSPEYFTEVKYLAHLRQQNALKIIDQTAKQFAQKFGRESGGLVRYYGDPNADTVIVAMGSVIGTVKDVIDELNAAGGKFAILTIVSYRPLPVEEIRAALSNAKRVIVLEKAFALGRGGVLAQEVELALMPFSGEFLSVIAGIGGRPITRTLLRQFFTQETYPEKTTFLGLNHKVVDIMSRME